MTRSCCLRAGNHARVGSLVGVASVRAARMVPSLMALAWVAYLVVAQGGFFGFPTCLSGVVGCLASAAVWLLGSRRGRRLPAVPLAFLGLAVSYLVSSLYNGPSLTTLSETGTWAACAGMSFLASAQDEDERSWTLTLLAWFGVITAVMGILVRVGAVPLAAGIHDGRLEFTFQYANTTAAWYGTCAYLCLFSRSEVLRWLAHVPVASMLLTLSGGGILAFMLVSLVVGAWLVASHLWDDLVRVLVQGAIGALAAACVYALASGISTILVLVMTLLSLWVSRRWTELASHLNMRVVGVGLVLLMAVVLAAMIALIPDRIPSALVNMGERLDHMRDGLGLWSTSPLLGIGPDNWQYLYPYVQTAVYTTVVVHCSFIQMMTDAGIVGIAFLVVACVLGIRTMLASCRARKDWSLAVLAATAHVLLHSLVDFDLQFGSLALVLAFFLSDSTSSASVGKGYVAGLATLAICLPLTIVGLYCSATSLALTRANQAGAYEEAVRLFHATDLAKADPGAQGEYVRAVFSQGSYEEVVRAYELMPAPALEEVLYTAISYVYLGERAEGARVLADRMEATPYDPELLEGAREFEKRFGVDASQRRRFAADMARSSELIEGRGPET